MKPATLDITIYQGSTFSQVFQWKSGSPSVPVNLTGYTARMQIREKFSSPDYVINLTTENGGIVFRDAVNGTFSIEMSATDTAAMNFKHAVYDIEFVSPSGIVTRLFGGSVTLSPEVTR
jgi:phage pi2 protein 07